MHNPTKKQWQKVIDNFKKVLPLAIREDHLNMSEARVNEKDNQCGTVHCVGGWYAVATLDTKSNLLSFSDGADEMAKHLGFTDMYRLGDWAHANSDIWGNDFGYNLFGHEAAYDDAENLTEVITFLEGVRDRSPE
jgi:hypothetical protein